MSNSDAICPTGSSVDLCLVRLEVSDEAAPNRVPVALRRPGEHGPSLRNACYARLFDLLHQRAGLSLVDFMLSIERDDFGRPQLPSGNGHLHFSVSHADTYGLVAVSDAPVGVDVERVDARYTDTLREFFGKSDLVDGDDALFASWVNYESVAKLLGVGLRLDVADLRNVDGQVFAAHHPVEILRLPAPTGHVAALASLSPVPTLHWAQGSLAPCPFSASTDAAPSARGHRIHRLNTRLRKTMETTTTPALTLHALQAHVAHTVKKPLNDVDVDQPLLSIGMHSLQALLLFTQLAKLIDFRVSMTDMLRSPTLRALAETLDNAGVGNDIRAALQITV